MRRRVSWRDPSDILQGFHRPTHLKGEEELGRHGGVLRNWIAKVALPPKSDSPTLNGPFVVFDMRNETM